MWARARARARVRRCVGRCVDAGAGADAGVDAGADARVDEVWMRAWLGCVDAGADACVDVCAHAGALPSEQSTMLQTAVWKLKASRPMEKSRRRARLVEASSILVSRSVSWLPLPW